MSRSNRRRNLKYWRLPLHWCIARLSIQYPLSVPYRYLQEWNLHSDKMHFRGKKKEQSPTNRAWVHAPLWNGRTPKPLSIRDRFASDKQHHEYIDNAPKGERKAMPKAIRTGLFRYPTKYCNCFGNMLGSISRKSGC